MYCTGGELPTNVAILYNLRVATLQQVAGLSKCQLDPGISAGL